MNRALTHPDYSSIHYWLKKTYGKADHCEHCTEPKIKFHWALRHYAEYEYKRENFLQLCVSCHMKYDQTDERRKANGKAQRQTDKSYCWTAIEKIHPETGEVIGVYESVTKAARENGISKSGISFVLTGRIEVIKNTKWRYKHKITSNFKV